MSRVADAYARAGIRLLDQEAQAWDKEHAAAGRMLGEASGQRKPAARPAAGETIDFELAAAVRRIFLAPGSGVRSVMFCTLPGDPMSDVAWRAAEALAAQSGQRVAFVEDPANRVAPSGAAAQGLITQVEWWDEELLPKFDFVIVNATASRITDLIQLARDVDGVVVLVSEGATRRIAAKKLVAALGDDARLLGTILVSR
jgi:hypothetical protein